MKCRITWAVGCLLVVGILACQTNKTGETVITKTSAIIGGDSHDVSNDQTLPARGVGWIEIANSTAGPGGFCTAIPIQRDVVLAAGHCLCIDNGGPLDVVTFHMQHVDPATGQIVDVGPLVNGVKQGIKSRDWHFQTRVCDPTTAHEPSDSSQDLAVVLLSSALSLADLPDLLAVYTNQDFMDHLRNKPAGDTFFTGPFDAIGYAGSIPDSPLKKLASTAPLFDQNKFFQLGSLCIGDVLCTNSAPGIWIHDQITQFQDAGSLSMEEGDSGGPITFLQNGVIPTVFGVFSLFLNNTQHWYSIVDHFNAWSPTWDNGQNNGAFIRQFLDDADGDGVSDAIDNCTPPRCHSPETCFNPGQEDNDGDGVGDACDNCPPSLCGATPMLCANPTQQDSDHDGLGDVCDTCPSVSSTTSGSADQDHDRIGDACDNCPTTPGGRRACKSDSDCGGHGFCIVPSVPGVQGGRCNDGTNRTCNTFLTSSCSSCVEIGMWGVCSESDEPDTDGDGIGDRCDRCPLVSDANLQLNSNRPAEQRQGASPLNDACESTPVFTARPVVEPFLGASAASTRVLFSAYAGVGTDGTALRADFVGAQVGFRQCNCRNVNLQSDIPFDTCLLTTCGNLRQQFDNPNEVHWKPVTVGVAPAGVFAESQVATPTLDPRIDPTYTDRIDCTDPLPHPMGFSPDEVGLCRLGTGRLLSWSYLADTQAGRVTSFTAPPNVLSGAPPIVGPVLQTEGLFWSHGLVPTPFVSAGTRDSSFSGTLRDHYVYVTTPSLSYDLPPIGQPILTNNCALGCLKVLSIDWLIGTITPNVGLNVFRLLQRPFAIVPGPGGILAGIRSSSEPIIDLNVALSTPAQLTLADNSRALVTPVEPFPKDPALGTGIFAISIPKSWSQLNSDVEALGNGFGGTLDIVTAYQTAGVGLPENVVPFGGLGFVPSDRDGARSVFSKLEQALYFVGGATGGVPTQEIWRFDLATAAWTHLFVPSSHSQVGPRNVAAVGYDWTLGKLLVVDDSPQSAPQNARITVFDTHADTSQVAALADLSGFAKVGLIATGNGTFVLVGATQSSWTAYRLQVSTSNQITWLGKTSGQGMAVADPIAWQEGPGFLIQTGQSLNPVDLPVTAFTPSGTPPELQVCDHTPVVGTLPAVTLSSCHLSSLQPPVPSSACGPVTFNSNAPVNFPLGATVVTWTFTDALGNVVTAPQTVTAVLGDDPTCCPAGTNVIMGTSNNDNIVGTAGSDCILGLGGQDNISGGGGDDYISGGDGDDIIDGGSGNDHIWGGSGQDQITGGIGNDFIDGGDGDDTCHGGDGDDVIHGGNGQDHLFGENGNDQLFGDDGDDTLDGGAGNDSLNGGGLHDVCIGGTGTNTFAMCQTIR